jgi:hypothetical protein
MAIEVAGVEGAVDATLVAPAPPCGVGATSTVSGAEHHHGRRTAPAPTVAEAFMCVPISCISLHHLAEVTVPVSVSVRRFRRCSWRSRALSGTVTLIEKCSGAVGFEAVATEHRWSFTFQAAASGAVT